MGDRLKQIWAGFEETTDRNLTGKGVENVIVPHRADYLEDDVDFLPEGFEAPADAAFAALRADLEAKGKKFGAKKARPSDAVEQVAKRFTADDLFRGMRATEMRTERYEMDYEAFLGTDEGKRAFKKRRKKFFGIF